MTRIPDITPFAHRLNELEAAIAAPHFFSDQRKAAALSREHQKLKGLLGLYEKWSYTERCIQENKELCADAQADPELREIAREEIPQLEAQLLELEEAVLLEMIPPDESDSRNTIIEIRAGAGGDEAALFCAQLYRMYQYFVQKQGWRLEPLGVSPSERNGLKDVSFLVTGENVYKRLKYESGVHRVQRVPETEANGRIHTSTVTVAVLPEAQEVDIHIDPQDLEITVSRASGPGGQGVNTTDSAVQIIHKPTGITVNCADERSQIKNKEKAMKVLYARLLRAKKEEEEAKYASQRRDQIGSGDRSERIRTYNFPQSRLTDHRIGLTLHGLTQIMEGEIDALIDALYQADCKKKVEGLNRSAAPGGG